MTEARVGGGGQTFSSSPIGSDGRIYLQSEDGDTFVVETMGFNCTECHPSIFEAKEKHKSLQMSHKRQAQSCGACHNGKQAFDLRSNCYVCHIKEGK